MIGCNELGERRSPGLVRAVEGVCVALFHELARSPPESSGCVVSPSEWYTALIFTSTLTQRGEAIAHHLWYRANNVSF